MLSYPKRIQVFAIASAALAGFVDAVAFVQLGGFFVSFMSGNSTRLGVGAAFGVVHALTALALIAAFVAGVVAGSAVGRAAQGRRRVWVMLAVAALLAIAAFASMKGQALFAALFSASGMGAINAVLEENGESRIGLTYMTGALVKVGQRVTDALFGGPRWAWAPYLLLWTGLVGGALAGALVFRLVGDNALWFAVALTLGLTALIRWERRPLDASVSG